MRVFVSQHSKTSERFCTVQVKQSTQEKLLSKENVKEEGEFCLRNKNHTASQHRGQEFYSDYFLNKTNRVEKRYENAQKYENNHRQSVHRSQIVFTYKTSLHLFKK